METKLFNYFVDNHLLTDFNSMQVEKFRFACKKAVAENPKLHFSDLRKACKIYYTLISLNPNVDLGDIIIPD